MASLYSGEQYWSAISQEHGIEADGSPHQGSFSRLESISAYYEEKACGKYIPRAVLVDTEPGTMDSIRSGSVKDLFPIDNFVMGHHCPPGEMWVSACRYP